MTSKKKLSERDICTKFIIPALKKAGWDIKTQIREEVYLTNGKILVRGILHSRGNRKRADIVLYYKPNIPIAIIEVKDNNHSVIAGLQQAMVYRELLVDIPVVYSTNGDAFYEHDYLKDSGDYSSPIKKKFQWRNWATNPEGITGIPLIEFIDEKLFPYTLQNSIR